MKKFVKGDEIPLHELCITKKATFDVLMKHFTDFFDYPNPKKGRLLIED